MEPIFLFFFLTSFFFFFFLFLILIRLNERVAQQKEINLKQAKEIEEIKEKILLANQIQDHLRFGLEKTREIIEELRRLNEQREKLREEREKEFLERLKRVDEILVGTSAKGLSGEEILREIFKKLPPEMIESNFKVRGKIVEFALVLPNGKRIPIDSKWPAGKLILELEKESDPQKKKEISEKIEKEVIERIKEVKQYLDPDLTWSQAIVALPDSVYSLCKHAHLKAREENVILMPYSMVLPLLLYMYRLHLQYSISIDIENFQTHLISIIKNLEEMENILENKIWRGAQMIYNAHSEYKNLISQIKNSLTHLKLKGSDNIKKLN